MGHTFLTFSVKFEHNYVAKSYYITVRTKIYISNFEVIIFFFIIKNFKLLFKITIFDIK